MYKVGKTLQAEQRQRQIEKALISMLRTKRLSQITVTALCEQAQIPRKSFYYYFDTLEDVLEAVMDTAFYDMVAYAGQDEKWSAREVAARHFQFWQEHRELLLILEKNNMSGMLLGSLLKNMITKQHNFNLQTQQDDLRAAQDNALLVNGGGFCIMMNWILTEDPRTPAQMGELLVDLITEPLFNEWYRKLCGAVS